ncbi:hypothetical protein ACWCP6_32005 [Streptomyces sp. NPDC002004]
MPMVAAVFAATGLGLAGTWHASAGETPHHRGTTVEVGVPGTRCPAAPGREPSVVVPTRSGPRTPAGIPEASGPGTAGPGTTATTQRPPSCR